MNMFLIVSSWTKKKWLWTFLEIWIINDGVNVYPKTKKETVFNVTTEIYPPAMCSSSPNRRDDLCFLHPSMITTPSPLKHRSRESTDPWHCKLLPSKHRTMVCAIAPSILCIHESFKQLESRDCRELWIYLMADRISIAKVFTCRQAKLFLKVFALTITAI